MPLDNRDQCASFDPLVVHFGTRPLIAGQSGLSALVVDGPNTDDTMVQGDPGKNATQDPPAENAIGRKEKRGKTSRTLKRTTSTDVQVVV